jgi:hypothetical protein
MEDRVEIARELYGLNSRRGVIHVLANQLLSSGKILNNNTGILERIDLQSRSFYTFINHLYEWYIRKEEGDPATHFWLPLKGNPLLAVTYAPNREEEMREKYIEEAIIIEESEMARCFDGSRWKILPTENTNELFAESLPKECRFYIGHVLSTAVWAAHQKPKKDCSRLVDELLRENDVLEPFMKNEKYVRAILEKEPAGYSFSS